MEKKKLYIKPTIKKIELDSSISLVMMTTIPDNPNPRGSKGDPKDEPFSSPFNNDPFG